MKSFAVAGSLALLLLLPSLHAADDPGWKVAVAGLRVVAPNQKDNLRAFSWSPGTTVALLITAPQGKIVSMDQEGSSLTAFTDDQGKNLLAGHSEDHFFQNGFQMMSSFSDDDSSATKLVEASASEAPTPGALRLHLTGKLMVQTAAQTATLTAENVELKPGTQFQLGKLALTVSSTGLAAGGFSGNGMEVSLRANQDLSSVAKLEFFDEKGNSIEADRSGNSSFSTGSLISVTWNYSLKQKVDKVKIVATCWTDLKTETVPVDVTTGVGL
ncbi:MAG TPA: hypothetical protein VL527_13960 [Dongiaceae bacterium]|jgi:hypothetical protein|nr:hypothetical protein [Dongiaceae bacterium]